MNGNLLSLSEFGRRLYNLRIKAGYNIPKELALVLCGYSKNTAGLIGDEAKTVDRLRRNIENWELGKNYPRTTMIAKLCNILDCDPEYLLYKEFNHPRKEIKSAADLVGISEEAIESIIRFTHSEGLPKKTPFILPGYIISLILTNPSFYEITANILKTTEKHMILQHLCAEKILIQQESIPEYESGLAGIDTDIKDFADAIESYGYTVVGTDEMIKMLEYRTNQSLGKVVQETIAILHKEAAEIMDRLIREMDGNADKTDTKPTPVSQD